MPRDARSERRNGGTGAAAAPKLAGDGTVDGGMDGVDGLTFSSLFFFLSLSLSPSLLLFLPEPSPPYSHPPWSCIMLHTILGARSR